MGSNKGIAQRHLTKKNKTCIKCYDRNKIMLILVTHVFVLFVCPRDARTDRLSAIFSTLPCIQIVRHVGITDWTLEHKLAFTFLCYFHKMLDLMGKKMSSEVLTAAMLVLFFEAVFVRSLSLSNSLREISHWRRWAQSPTRSLQCLSWSKTSHGSYTKTD